MAQKRFRKTPRRSTKRAKTYRRKSRRTSSLRRTKFLGNGIPSRVRTKLKYVDNITMTSSSGALGTYVWRATSVYDPDYAFGGHQPMYFDQMAALYNHYIVNKAYIVVDFTPYDQLASSSSVVFLTGDDGASLTSTTIPGILETRGTKYRHVPIYGENQVYNRRLSMGYNKKKTFGNYKNSELSASVGASPTEGYYFIMGIRSDDNTTTTSMHCVVTIVYDVTFYELKDIAQS